MANIDPFYKNPASAAMPYLQKIPSTITPYYQPYIDKGNQALSDTFAQYSKLISNPGGVLNDFGKDYQQSPGYEWTSSQATGAANNSAAAGGMLGTPQNQEQSAEAAGHVADEDYWNYMQNVFGLYTQGLSGEQHVSDTGYKASSSLADDLGKNLQSESGLAFNGAASQDKANSDFLGSLLSGITYGLEDFF